MKISNNQEDYSILSDNRKGELNNLLEQNKGPVIAGWGSNSGVRKIAEKALKHHLLQNITGIEHKQRSYYLHSTGRH